MLSDVCLTSVDACVSHDADKVAGEGAKDLADLKAWKQAWKLGAEIKKRRQVQT